jgi:hypothetical protein
MVKMAEDECRPDLPNVEYVFPSPLMPASVVTTAAAKFEAYEELGLDEGQAIAASPPNEFDR